MSPLKNDGFWEMILSFWVSVTFQGLCLIVKLQVGNTIMDLTLQGTITYLIKNGIFESMIFLFLRWDMLISLEGIAPCMGERFFFRPFFAGNASAAS